MQIAWCGCRKADLRLSRATVRRGARRSPSRAQGRYVRGIEDRLPAAGFRQQDERVLHASHGSPRRHPSLLRSFRNSHRHYGARDVAADAGPQHEDRTHPPGRPERKDDMAPQPDTGRASSHQCHPAAPARAVPDQHGSGTRSGTTSRSLSPIRADAVSKTEGRRFEPCRPCPVAKPFAAQPGGSPKRIGSRLRGLGWTGIA